MSQIVEPKTYTGKDLETIIFRPMLSGASAEELGIRVMYNMPVPTVLGFWKGTENILKNYSTGWSGGEKPEKTQKTLELRKIKAEMGHSASDYFSKVWEEIVTRPDVNMDDLSGTELEEAETKLFRQSLAESLRATMWIGDTTRANGKMATFDGFLTRIVADASSPGAEIPSSAYTATELNASGGGEAVLKKVWDKSSPELKALKSEGNLVMFVTDDIYSKYEESLDSATLEAAYIARQQGRESLSWRGIPVVDMQLTPYKHLMDTIPSSMVILTDRRNLALAVNTADFPGTEVRMWYNPDEMENRQRAIFAVGCDYLVPELISVAALS